MKEYKIEIMETLSKIITIKANDKDEAIDKIRDQYKASRIVLDENDFVDYEINILEGE